MIEIYLIIQIEENFIAIPFKSLKQVDSFTIDFKNLHDLAYKLSEIFNFEIPKSAHMYAHIQYKYQKGKYHNEENLPIKYSNDDFSKEDIKRLYIKLYSEKPEVLKRSKKALRYIIDNYLKKREQALLTSEDIPEIISLYFETNYKRYRDAYFYLKSSGYQVKTVKHETKRNHNSRTNLANYEAKDSFLSYLQDYSNYGEEEKERVMDYLAGYDITELRHNLINDNHGLFDGEGITEKEDNRDIMIFLEKITGMKIEELQTLINSQNNHTRHKR